jgi:hypothetical protein
MTKDGLWVIFFCEEMHFLGLTIHFKSESEVFDPNAGYGAMNRIYSMGPNIHQQPAIPLSRPTYPPAIHPTNHQMFVRDTLFYGTNASHDSSEPGSAQSLCPPVLERGERLREASKLLPTCWFSVSTEST